MNKEKKSEWLKEYELKRKRVKNLAILSIVLAIGMLTVLLSV